MSIAANLGRLAACNQFFVYRLTEWDATRSKWKRKQPWSIKHDNNIKPDKHYNWMSYDAALALASRQPVGPDLAWCVGMWITDSLNVFFLDIDGLPADYTATPAADALLQRFPGCMLEWSSSKRGLHIIGRRTAYIEHSNDNDALGLELYTDGRGIALNIAASGSADTDATDAFVELATSTFPPRARGPANGLIIPPLPGVVDFAALSLVLRMCDRVAATPVGGRNAALNTAAFTIGGMVGAGRVSQAEARDSLIAAVTRAGWDDLPTQIKKINDGIESGMAEPINVTVPVVPSVPVVATAGVPDVPVTVDWASLSKQAIEMINGTVSLDELVDKVLPQVVEMRFDSKRISAIEKALYDRYEVFNAKMPLTRIRALLNPPTVLERTTDRPDWINAYCYVQRLDKFYNTVSGSLYSAEGFRMETARFMHKKANGDREDPVKFARENWDIVTVEDLMYHPMQGTYFEHSSLTYANLYRLTTVPAITTPSDHCRICIGAFQDHLRLMCGNRPELYDQLLMWLAFNVQNPGHKIRWAPLLKGVHGDGKSIISDVMSAAMGEANIKTTSPNNLMNSGGFTDWSAGAALNFIEEVRVIGTANKHEIYNSLKLVVGDHRADINRKGKASTGTTPNVTNHFIITNYGDALPIDPMDRRFCVIFTPYANIEEAASAKGLPSVDSLVRHFSMLGASIRSEPGAWRGWLLGIDTSSFNPDGRAPVTDERSRMVVMSQDNFDQIVSDAIEAGGFGIHRDVFCSKHLWGKVEIESGEKPKTSAWNQVLSRLGYMQIGKPTWWHDRTHRIWIKKSMSPDEIRQILDTTKKNLTG